MPAGADRLVRVVVVVVRLGHLAQSHGAERPRRALGRRDAHELKHLVAPVLRRATHLAAPRVPAQHVLPHARNRLHAQHAAALEHRDEGRRPAVGDGLVGVHLASRL